MSTVVRWGAALAAFAGAAAAADADKPAADPGWVTHARLSGTVQQVGDGGFTLRVAWLAAGGSSGRSRPPDLSSGRLPSRNRPGRLKEGHADLELTFADGGLVRWARPPGKADDGGKKAPYSPAELLKLRQPAGAPGYAAGRDDLAAGHVVEVTVVRPKGLPAAKADDASVRVRYAVIRGTDPSAQPPKGKK